MKSLRTSPHAGLVFFCLLTLFSSKAFSLSDDDIEMISSEITWLKLLKYEKKSPFNNALKSAVNAKGFFLSENGETDATAELKATIEALRSPLQADPNIHAQCKFRGRFIWLKNHSQTKNLRWPKVTCPDYNEWSLNGTTNSISVIFATGYLGNPASYYGHTLLKLNSSTGSARTKLEDVSVNFGAIIPDADGPIPYIAKGLFGGYQSGFSHIQFYFHNHNYGEVELRDLWEYQLDLTNSELELILAHTWELFKNTYTYYFLNKNCVYRMAEILEIIPSIKAIPKNTFWTIPQSVIQQLASDEHDRVKPLVSKIRYIPSRQSRFYQRFTDLSTTEKNIFIRETSANHLFSSNTRFNESEIPRQKKILDTLLDYYQYLSVKEKDNNEWETKHREVLLKRFSLPPGSEKLTFKHPTSPDKSRAPSLIETNFIHNEKLNNGLTIKLRPAYYDGLDSETGQIPHSSLSMGEIELIVNDNKLSVNSLYLFKVDNTPRYTTGANEDKGNSWKVEVGAENIDLRCKRNCLTPFARGDLGKVFNLGKHYSLGYAVGGGVQENTSFSSPLYVSGRAYGFWDITNNINSKLTIEHRESVLSNEKYNPSLLKLETQWQFAKNNGLRLSIEKKGTWEARLGFRHYF